MHCALGDGTVRFGVFELDTRSGELRKRGVPIPLQQQPFRVLIRLVESPGEVVTREHLRQELWPAETYVDFEQGINGAVKRLREALGDSAITPRFIETLPKRGYRFILPIDATPNTHRSRAAWSAGWGGERRAAAERAVSKARFLIDTRLPHWLQESFTLLQQAVTAVPAFAGAHATMSQWYVHAAFRGNISYDKGFLEATRHAQEAVRLAPDSAEAVGALGRTYYARRFFQDAERTFQRALELDGAAGIVLGSYSELLTILGRHRDALTLVDAALKTEPHSGLLQEAKAVVLCTARDYSRCIEWCDAMRRVTPTSSELAYFRGTSQLMLGHTETARMDFSEALDHESNLPPARVAIGLVAHQLGQPEERDSLLQELKLQKVDPATLAEFYAGVGREEEALNALDAGFRYDSPQIMGIAVNPLLDPVRGHPRFRRLVGALQLARASS
jgi:DNA-binding winged helix-turn-helix (wHTH) protein